VIDTVAVDMTMIDADHRKLVPIGGIAHAGARGVSKLKCRWTPVHGSGRSYALRSRS